MKTSSRNITRVLRRTIGKGKTQYMGDGYNWMLFRNGEASHQRAKERLTKLAGRKPITTYDRHLVRHFWKIDGHRVVLNGYNSSMHNMIYVRIWK